MQVRIRSTGAVMYEGEFRALHPNTSFPQQISEETLNAFGADVVFEGPQAQPTKYQAAYNDGVEQDGQGRWFTKYSVMDIDAEAIALKDEEQAKSVRQSRDAKLKDTDWRFRSDLVPSQEWKDYCQMLRDIPSQSGFPWEVVWPIQPE
jgi:hypothetical protein